MRVPAAVGVTLTEQVADAPVPASVHVPPGVNVTVPLTLLPAVGCSTEMPFDDAADFAAGVCASAIKPANDRNISPIREAREEFI